MTPLAPRSRRPRIRVLAGGHWLIGFTILVGVVAAHAGAGQLHAFAALLLAFQAVSGLRSYRGLRHLSVWIEAPERSSVGATDRVRVRIENAKRWNAVSSLEVELVLEPGGPVGVAPAWIDRIEARATAEVALPVDVDARGVARTVEIRLSSAYPAHLFRRTLVFPVVIEVPVSPAVAPAECPPARTGGREEVGPRRAIDGGDEFLGVRPWREGESPRAIHPRTSARRGAPVVREDASASRPPFTLVVDPRGLADDALEHLLLEAASLLRAARRDRRRVWFGLAGGAVALDVRGARGESAALDAIARYVPTPLPPPPTPAAGSVIRLGAGAKAAGPTGSAAVAVAPELGVRT